MAFNPKEWKDAPDPTTPIDAAALADVEKRLSDYTDAQVAAGGGGGPVADASAAVKGVSKLSVDPAVVGNPVAVGDNDPRLAPVTPGSIGAATAADLAAEAAARTAADATKQDAATAVTLADWQDVASAATLTLPDTGTYFNITGNTAITGIAAPTVQPSKARAVVLLFNAALTLFGMLTTSNGAMVGLVYRQADDKWHQTFATGVS